MELKRVYLHSGSAIAFKEAFWLATGGGGEVLGLPVGQLSKGFLFDAIVIDTKNIDSDFFISEQEDTADDILQKLIYNTQGSNICEVWVAINYHFDTIPAGKAGFYSTQANHIKYDVFMKNFSNYHNIPDALYFNLTIIYRYYICDIIIFCFEPY